VGGVTTLNLFQLLFLCAFIFALFLFCSYNSRPLPLEKDGIYFFKEDIKKKNEEGGFFFSFQFMFL